MASNLPPNLVPKPEDMPNAPYQPDPMKQLQPIGDYKGPLNADPAKSPDAQMLAAPKAPSDKTTDFYRWVDDLKPEERKVMFPMRGLPAMPGASEARAFIDPEHPLTAPYNFYSMLEEPAKWYGKGVQWLHDNVFGGEPGVVEQHKALMEQADALRARGISPMSDDGYRKAAMDVAVNMVGGFGGVIKKLPSPGWAKFFGEQYPIAENPTLSELRIMAREQHRMSPTEQSKEAGGMGYVRVLQADGRTWAWPADAALHEDVRAKVGIKTQGFDYRDVLNPEDFKSKYIERFLPGYQPGPAYDATGVSGGAGNVQTLGDQGQDTLAGGVASDFLLPTLHQQRVASNVPADFPGRGAEILSQVVAQQDAANNAGVSPTGATAIASLPTEHVAATYDAMSKAESSAQLLSEHGSDAASDREAGQDLIHQGRPWAGYERMSGRKDPSLTAKIMDVLTGIATLPLQWARSPSFMDQMGEFERLRHEGHDPFTDPEMQQKAMDLVLQMNFGGVVGAYHGTPHTLAPEPGAPLGRFKTEAIGTGEGQQSYGHGFYFADSPEVAGSYQKKLAGVAEMTVGGKGSLYEVNLNVEPDELLQWDKPLSEQSPQVQEALGKAWPAQVMPDGSPASFPVQDRHSGQIAYADLADRLGSPQAASAALRDAGIPGIRYLDAGSRSAGEGSHNYVIFDPNAIEITGRNGEKLSKAEKAKVVEQQQAQTPVVTPSLASSASDIGRPEISSSTGVPPLAHRPFVQVSSAPDPSANVTSRMMDPLDLRGSVADTGFDPTRLGVIHPSDPKHYIIQGSEDYKALHAEAVKIQPRLDTTLRDTVSDIPGAAVYGSRAKDLPGLEGKLASGRPASTISDYLGARIVVDDAKAMDAVATKLKQQFPIYEADDFLDHGKFGYRAVHVQVGLGNGMTAEIQLVPKSIADVMEPLHAMRQPFKRVDPKELPPAEQAHVLAKMAEVDAGFTKAWNPDKFYKGRPKPALANVDFRSLPLDQATAYATYEPHIIPKESGGFVGAPPALQTRGDITAMRKNVDKAVQTGLEWQGWYRKGRLGNEAIAGPDPARQNMLARLWAMFSWQHSPDMAINDSIRAVHQHMTDTPIRGGTPEQNRMAGEALASGDPSRMELGLKSEPYGQALTPGAPWPSVGINDRHMARLFGWDQASAPGGGSAGGPQHTFMDGETILATKRANEARMGGRSDWTPAEVQELGWFAQKGKTDGTAFYNSKQNINPKTGEHFVTLDEAIKMATKEASQAKSDFFPKYTMNMTGEQTPGSGSGHLAGIQNAPLDVRQKYNDAAKWMTDVQGRDMLAGRVGSWVRTDGQATGLWQGEINPVTVNHPMVAIAGRKGNHSVEPSSQGVVDTLGWLKAYVDVQHGEGSNIAIRGNTPENAPGFSIAMPHPTTVAQQQQLEQVLNAQGLFHIDNGDSVLVLPHDTGNPAAIDAAIENGLPAQLKQILPESVDNGERVGTGGNLVGPMDMLRADRQGTGAITHALFDQLRKYPKIMEAIDQGSELADKARQNLDRDRQIWQWEEGGKKVQAGAPRADFETAWNILNGPKPLQRLWEALQSGKVLLPGIVIAGIFSGVLAKQKEEKS